MRFLLMIAAAAFVGSVNAAAPDSHVVVISIDGLGAREMQAKPSCLAEKSTIRALAAKGAWSRGVTGILPTITYPTHATIVTGVTPNAHGVIDNGLRGVWFSQRSAITGETLWDAARKAGRSVAIVTWPSTYGADADWLIPEDLSNGTVATEDIRKGSTPGLFDALATAVGKPALVPFADPKAGEPLDEMTAKFAAEVVRRHKPQLLLTHFLDYDHRMHAMPWSEDACKALARTDAWIAHILEAYRSAGILERTTVFVVSDHGFLEVSKNVSLYPLLEASGWRELFPGVDLVGAFDFKIAGGSAALYPGQLKDIDAPRLAELRRRIEHQQGKALRWLPPAEAQKMGGFPGALVVLCARPGFSFALPAPGGQLLLDAKAYHGIHGHCPDQVEMDATFIASGFGIRPAGAVGKMAMVDVGPTIGAFLEVKLPHAAGSDQSARFGLRGSFERSKGR